MAHHKRRRAPHQRGEGLGKDRYAQNSWVALLPQERRARESEAAGWTGDDFSWVGPDAEDIWYFGDRSRDIDPVGRQRDHGRGGARKPFAIECRWIGGRFGSRGWRTHRRYETAARRAQALAHLGKGKWGYHFLEFRIPEGEGVKAAA